MKKLLSLILSVCLISSFSITGLALDTADYELKGASVTLDGTADQTVEISLIQAKEKNLIALEGSFSTKETEETNYVSLSEFKSPVDLTGTNYSDVASGKIVYADAALEGYAVAAGGAAMTVVYTVSKDTPAGKYSVQFNAVNIQDYDFVSVKNQTYTAEITVTRNDTPVTTGYTVTLSSDAQPAGIAKGKTFNVSLDVSNSDSTVTGFNAFSGTLSYDTTKVSYTGSEKIDEFGVQNDSNTGTLTITRADKVVDISKNPDLSLNFTANAAGEAKFELKSASVKVDAAANAEKQDAPVATISGSPLTVTVLETYTVTFARGGDSVTGTDPTQAATVESGTFKLPANPYTYENHTFAGWNDGTTTYQAEDTYTMPANDVTFTAQWTEDTEEPTVTGSATTDYVTAGDGYTLIEATIDQSGNVPTYDGNDMIRIGEKYYYAVEGSTYDERKLGFKPGTAEEFEKTKDVNLTGKIDINDAQFVYNIVNGVKPTTDITKKLLRADANGQDGVNTADCAAVIDAIQ